MKRVGDRVELRQERGVNVAGLVESFWRAAAASNGSDRYRNLAAPATAAADALLRMAAEDAEEQLRAILRPNLDVDEVTWTVACFEIGCVAPAGLHQVATACEALASLVSCQERSHVASELVCTAPEGLQWVALARADRRFAFQFPDLGNVSAPEPTVATLAVTRWRRHLSFMEACLFVDELPDDDVPVPLEIDAPRATIAPDRPVAVTGTDTETEDETETEHETGTEYEAESTVEPGTSADVVDLTETSETCETSEPAADEPTLDEPTDPPVRNPVDDAADDTVEQTRRDDLAARREEARRALRKTVATNLPAPGAASQPAQVGGDVITNQALSTALRSAIAEVVPFLERYLLDAVGSAVVEAVSTNDGAPGAELAKLVETLPAEIAAQLRPDLEQRLRPQDPGLLSEALVTSVRNEVHGALQDMDQLQRERLRRLSDLTTAVNMRQGELRSWMLSIRQIEEHLSVRFDALEHQLQRFEQRTDDAVEQVRVEQRIAREDRQRIASADDHGRRFDALAQDVTEVLVEQRRARQDREEAAPEPGGDDGRRIDELSGQVEELRGELASAIGLLGQIRSGLLG